MATERHRETYGPAIQILEKAVVVVIGTGGDADFKAAANRIGKLIAHDMYMYGRHDVEVITDREYHARIKALEQQGEEKVQLTRTNLVLIGDACLNRMTQYALARTEQEGKGTRGCILCRNPLTMQLTCVLAILK